MKDRTTAGLQGRVAAADEALMEEVARGGHAAFAELLSRHERSVRTFAGRAIGDFQMAEDIAQEAFLRVWKTAPRWRPEGSFRSWLLTIVTRLCIDYGRKRRPVFTDAMPDFSKPGADVIKTVVGREWHEIVARLLLQLPDRQRLAILLVYAEGYKTLEAARIMDMRHKAFESLLRRCRLRLREQLERSEK